jgi:hypothetical protein
LNPEGKQVGRHAGVAGRRPVTKSLGKVDRYRAGNIVAAEIILADAVRYGGEESLMVWARRVLQNLGTNVPIPKTEAEAA